MLGFVLGIALILKRFTLKFYSRAMSWIEWWSSKRYVHPEPMNGTLFEKRVCAEGSKLRILRWDHLGLGFLVRNILRREEKERRDRQRRCEDEGRACSDMSTSQEMTSIVGSRQKPGEKHRVDSSSEPPRWTNPADNLLLRILASKPERINLHCFKTPLFRAFVMVATGNKHRP